MGAYNLNLLLCNDDNRIDVFLNMLMSFFLLPLITKPTRITNASSTLIDNIFCNVQPYPPSGIVVSDLSDHFPVYCRLSLGKLNCEPRGSKSVRKGTPENIAKLKHKDSFGKSENLSKIFFAEILVFDHDYEGKSSSSNGLL